MNLRSIFFILFLVNALCFKGVNGKELLKKFERAETLYSGGNYKEAIPVYLELYASDTTNSNICFKLGSCYLRNGHQHKNAVYFLEKAVLKITIDYPENDKKESRAPVKAYKLLGDAYHLNNNFDNAINAYKKYRQLLVNNKLADKEDLKEITRRIEICNTAKELTANPTDVKIKNLGAAINSSFPDYSPRLTADQNTMIFTSRRPTTTGGSTYDGGQYFEDIYISKKVGSKWSDAVNIGWPVNTIGNEAAIGLSADGQEMLIYKDDMGNGNIYSSCLDGDQWTTPVKLNSNINSEWWEPCAFVSADGNTLFFISDRPGGYGGTDIYKSRKGIDGDWGKAVNLGPTINSPYDEYAPFIHPDGRTLFFSSKGHKTMGGFDIFYSSTLLSDENAWLEPVNIGYPINSTGDDAFYMVSPDKKTAYYSSYRDDGLGEKDNYMIMYPEDQESSISLIKGKMVDHNNRAVTNGVITITDNQTNYSGVHHANAKTGEYLVVLPPGSYNISYEADGLLFFSINHYVSAEKSFNEEKRDVKLEGLTVGSRIMLNNIFFDFDDATLRGSSKAELDKLYQVLVQHPELSVEVTGYCDSKGTDEYNKRLSLERARSVANYLSEKGIDSKRVIPMGVGKDASESEDGPENGLKPSGRRAELKIISINKKQ